jgi:hypothetical protein
MNSKSLLTLLAAAALIALFYQQHKAAPLAAAKPLPLVKSATTVKSQAPAEAEPKHYRPAAASDSVRREADAVAKRHQGMTKEQLEQSAEIKQLGERFFGHLDSPEFKAKLKQATEAIKAVKGIERGTLDFEFLDDLTTPSARAWLEAALSDDPQHAQDYLMNLLDGAIFELALDPTTETTTDGLTVKGTAPASTPAPEATPN